jgi:hypothetical protein
MRPQSPTGLFWSIRGEVACDQHAPAEDDPRWVDDGWDSMPTSSARLQTSRYQCQHCADDGRAVVPNVEQPTHRSA